MNAFKNSSNIGAGYPKCFPSFEETLEFYLDCLFKILPKIFYYFSVNAIVPARFLFASNFPLNSFSLSYYSLVFSKLSSLG